MINSKYAIIIINEEIDSALMDEGWANRTWNGIKNVAKNIKSNFKQGQNIGNRQDLAKAIRKDRQYNGANSQFSGKNWQGSIPNRSAQNLGNNSQQNNQSYSANNANNAQNPNQATNGGNIRQNSQSNNGSNVQQSNQYSNGNGGGRTVTKQEIYNQILDSMKKANINVSTFSQLFAQMKNNGITPNDLLNYQSNPQEGNEVKEESRCKIGRIVDEELKNVIHKEGNCYKIRGHKGKGNNESDGDWNACYKTKKSAKKALEAYFANK